MTAPDALAAAIAAAESSVPGLKPDNQARIVFDGDDHGRRPLSVVYLHGFTASQGEGDPAHRAIAEACHAHLYLSRLAGHGTDLPEAMAGITPEQWVVDAERAWTIGRALGERVVLVGTSMGATLALDLAERHGTAVAAVVAWSPGIRVHDPASLRAVLARHGAVEVPEVRGAIHRRYWSSVVHTDGYRALARLFDERMRPERLGRVACPVFIGLWDGGEGDRDTLASVAAMREAYGWLGTPPTDKRLVAYDHAAHVLASPARSAAAGRVLADTLAFLRDEALAR